MRAIFFFLAWSLQTSWKVNLGPFVPAPVSVSVCTDGSALSSEADTPLVRVDANGTVRSTDFLIRGASVICLSDGYAELQGKKVLVRRWNGRLSEYAVPAVVRSALALPYQNLLLITASGPLLLDLNAGSTRVLTEWGPPAGDLPDSTFAVNDQFIAIVPPGRTQAEFRDVQTFRPVHHYQHWPVVRYIPSTDESRDISFGAGFLPDGRLVIQMRPQKRTLLVVVSPDGKRRSEIDITRRRYGLLHGVGSDGCLVFSAFHPDEGKVLRKVCLTE